MQDQGRRLMIAVALAIVVWVGWAILFPPKRPGPPPPVAAGTSAPAVAATSQVGVASGDHPTPPTAVASSAGSGSGSGSAAPVPAPVVPPVVARGPEQTIKLAYPHFVASFSSYGGVLRSWRLTDPRYERSETKGEMVPMQADARSDGGAFLVNFVHSPFVLPTKSEWTGTKVSDTEIKYTLSTPELEVEKLFTVVPDAYLVRMAVKVKVKAALDHDVHQRLAISVFGFQDPKHAGGGSSRTPARAWESSTSRDGTIVSTPITDLIDPSGGPRKELNITWTGFEHPYLLAAYAPRPVNGNTVEKHTYGSESGVMQTDLWFSESTATRDAPSLVSHELIGYLGPKNLDQLRDADTAAGFPAGFGGVIDLGWFAPIGKVLLWLLLKFFSVFGNWGIAIVLLTVLVKGLTIPFTTKSMRSMKGMAVIGPQLKALNEKYKNDKQRLQLETMALYKQYGVNPLSGCLPILLQMPIWLALYRMLSSAGELYNQPFIPGWIDDLTAADPFHVLPVVLVITMFVQARLTPQNPDPSQKTQQMIMQYGMPLMFGVMSFFFPAGLTLYIFTNTCLSALHSIYMNKFDKKSLAIAAQIEKARAAAAAPAAKNANVKDAKNANVKDAKDANVKDAKDAADDDDEGDDEDSEGTPGAATSAAGGRAVGARQKSRRNKKARR